jgi:hypothetical protein
LGHPPGFVASPAEGSSACPDDGVVNVSVELENQSAIDRLTGCERVVGDVWLRAGLQLDYTPLRSLRDVEGTLLVRGEGSPAAHTLESLRGLEEAGGIELLELQLDSLEPLSGLRRLGATTSTGLAPSEAIDKETAPEDRDYVSFYGLAVVNCAGLTSLGGLRSLEELDELVLVDNPDLENLEGLIALRELSVLRLSGGAVDLREGLPVHPLSVSRSRWADLSPLGDARVLESLELLDNAALASLTGAQLPEHLESLTLSNNPVLANLDGLDALASVERLSIATVNQFPGESIESQLTSLTGLSGLQRVEELRLYGQARLRSLAGLEALTQIELLEFSYNLALESVEALAHLERVGRFFLLGSPALESLSLGSTSIGALALLDVGIVDLTGLEQVSVETEFGVWRAPQLASLRGLPQLGPDVNVSLNELPG